MLWIVAPALRMLYRKHTGRACVVFHRSQAVLNLPIKSIRKPLNPDQIVYCKAGVLELEPGSDLQTAFDTFVDHAWIRAKNRRDERRRCFRAR